jgi:hypothetical protein
MAAVLDCPGFDLADSRRKELTHTHPNTGQGETFGIRGSVLPPDPRLAGPGTGNLSPR